MRKKFFTAILTFTVIGSLAVPYSPSILADEYDFSAYVDGDDNSSSEQNGNGLIDSGTEIITDDPTTDDPINGGGEIIPEDIKLSVSNKKINVGSCFRISIEQANPDDWEEYEEDDWEQCCEDYIESIEYKSKKSYIAKVNSNGVVKGKHRGKTIIIVTVYFKNGAKKESKVRVQVRN